MLRKFIRLRTTVTVERFNGTLIRMLSLYVSQNKTDWDSLLPGILFGYHTSYHQSIKSTPLQILYYAKRNYLTLLQIGPLQILVL